MTMWIKLQLRIGCEKCSKHNILRYLEGCSLRLSSPHLQNDIYVARNEATIS